MKEVKNITLPADRGILEFTYIKLIEYTDDAGVVWNSIHVHSDGQAIVIINKPYLKELARLCLHNQPWANELIQESLKENANELTHP